MATHAAVAAQLGKPLLLEEFGKKLAPVTSAEAVEAGLAAARNPIFASLFRILEQSIEKCAFHIEFCPILLSQICITTACC